jgi:hypothetical protein
MGFSFVTLNRFYLAIFLLLGGTSVLVAQPCAVCTKPLELEVLLVTDQVTGKKVEICPACARTPERCAQCGLPVFKGYLELPDKRVLCARDRKSAVLSDQAAREICEQTVAEFIRSFGRIISIPDRNVSVELVDRVTLATLFQLPGRDMECPNIWGFLRTTTNSTGIHHDLRLLSALPPEHIRSVCVHEYGHAWINENVSLERRARIHRDAVEGFCELLAWLLADLRNDTAQVRLIEANPYTRGQLALFRKAYATYGLNEVIEWVLNGEDDRLIENEIGRVRRLEYKPSKPAPTPVFPSVAYTAAPRPVATQLQLKAITWSKIRPLVVINNETFAVNDQAKVAIGGTNVTVRCLAITPDSVRVRVLEWNREQVLSLP